MPMTIKIVKQAPCKIMSLQRCYGPGCQQSRSIVQCNIYGADIRLKRPEQTETVEQRDQQSRRSINCYEAGADWPSGPFCLIWAGQIIYLKIYKFVFTGQ